MRLLAAFLQGLRNKQTEIDLAKEACNADMVCDSCSTKQRNRAFCYFCNATQRVPICAECGATKCVSGASVMRQMLARNKKEIIAH